MLSDEKVINETEYFHFYEKAEELSRMLYAMIRNLEE